MSSSIKSLRRPFKVLLDTGISHKHVATLSQAGHDAVWAGESEDLGDKAILQRAFDEQRILVTLDKDFGELAVRENRPHSGIIRITAGYLSAEQPSLIVETLSQYGDQLLAGSIITLEKGRPVRIRQT